MWQLMRPRMARLLRGVVGDLFVCDRRATTRKKRRLNRPKTDQPDQKICKNQPKPTKNRPTTDQPDQPTKSIKKIPGRFGRSQNFPDHFRPGRFFGRVGADPRFQYNPIASAYSNIFNGKISFNSAELLSPFKGFLHFSSKREIQK